MMITVTGLIIKETNVGEGNKIITILTPEFGKIQAGASGARSYKSKLIAGCQLFCFTKFILSKKKDWYSVTSAEPIETFYNLRIGLEKLSLATYFCDLLCEISTDAHGAREVIQLALNAFYIITKSENLSLIKAAFELRLMSISGFKPELSRCAACGKAESLTGFSINDGSVYCDECNNGGTIANGVLLAMRHITSSQAKRLFCFTVPTNVLSELSKIAENYTLSNIGRDFRSLKYYLTIIKNMV